MYPYLCMAGGPSLEPVWRSRPGDPEAGAFFADLRREETDHTKLSGPERRDTPVICCVGREEEPICKQQKKGSHERFQTQSEGHSGDLPRVGPEEEAREPKQAI